MRLVLLTEKRKVGLQRRCISRCLFASRYTARSTSSSAAILSLMCSDAACTVGLWCKRFIVLTSNCTPVVFSKKAIDSQYSSYAPTRTRSDQIVSLADRSMSMSRDLVLYSCVRQPNPADSMRAWRCLHWLSPCLHMSQLKNYLKRSQGPLSGMSYQLAPWFRYKSDRLAAQYYCGSSSHYMSGEIR